VIERPPFARLDGQPLVNALSVDVEDYFQVQAFENNVERGAWDSYPSRVERNTDALLQIWDDAGVKATFFTLGWVAERHPALVRRIGSSRPATNWPATACATTGSTGRRPRRSGRTSAARSRCWRMSQARG
jgi:peptidoglycan/xylan/chitin deacetylase (PgdA/CDA1 family)